MIFLSYTHANKSVVQKIAKNLSSVFGEESIFYDEWSIQPGEGIIEKMNEGLEKCKFFFFFISKNSLESNMVKLEWQNALYKKTKNNDMKFIPVKLDNCLIPSILLQTLYIDIFNCGVDIGITNIIEVISEKNISRTENIFYNVRAYVKDNESELTIEFRAEFYTEPQSRYLILTENTKDEIDFKSPNEGIFHSGFVEEFQLSNGFVSNAILLSRDSATSPGFPFIAEIKTKNKSKIAFKGVMRAVSRERYETVPIIYL